MEFIGCAIEVAAGAQAGIRGTVVDETRNTLRVAAGGREWVVPKRGSRFLLTFPDGSAHRLEGDDIAYRPEDRIRRAGVSR